MEQEKTIYFSVIDYSQSPGPRYCSQGDDSGEDFYHSILNSLFAQAYREGKSLKVTLDGADGYASSFLDEAFGNLVFDFGKDVVQKLLLVVSNDEDIWETMIKNETTPEWEKRRKNGDEPIVTANHQQWYRIVNGELKEDIWIKKK